MRFCENCGALLKDGLKFCENCGCALSDVIDEKVEEGVQAFCENCGAKLVSGLEFCENCGAKVPHAINNSKVNENNDSASFNYECDWMNCFASNNWKETWLKYNKSQTETGIIFTNCETYQDENNGDEDLFIDTIQDFCMKAYERNNVRYFLLDVSSNAVSYGTPTSVIEHVNILKKICNEAVPKYLFILGDTSYIPKIYFDNITNDGDGKIASDLCYASLDTISPSEGQQYNPDNFIQVGRLPSVPRYCFSDILRAYIQRMQKNIDEVRPFGVTALPWTDTSSNVYKRLTTSASCHVSPSVTIKNINQKIKGDENFLYFNVHGSPVAEYWFGQQDQAFPPVTSPAIFSAFNTPYIIGVEACFGGKFEKENSVATSTVLTVFTSHCVSMLASSATAYGSCCGNGNNADILIGRYLQDMKNGYTAGQSYINGLKELIGGLKHPTSTKTLMEFSLFGDPSYRRSGKSAKKSFSVSKAFGAVAKNAGVKRGIKVPLPDVRKAVKLCLTQVDEKIANPIAQHVCGSYQGFEHSTPSFYEMLNSNLKLATFESENTNGKSILHVYFDEKGKILEEAISK